jgi:hypothetical protein
MNEQELRAIVRGAVERHLGVAAPAASLSAEPVRVSAVQRAPASHASHGLYAGLINVGDACVIEPAVPCDHCGYCKSHGH